MKVLDSKKVYIACHHYLKLVNWRSVDGSEWIYVGDGTSLEGSILDDFVKSFFGDDEGVYIVVNRSTVHQTNAQTVASHIFRKREFFDFTVCDQGYSRFLQVSKIGVARRGCVD